VSEVVRYCRYCRTNRPNDEFHEPFRCSQCAKKGAGERSVAVTLDGWEMEDPCLPEMRVPTREEIEAGYEGVRWSARKKGWALEVVWRGDRGKYVCRSLQSDDEDHVFEECSFDYPHEVVEWVGTWVAQVGRARRPLGPHE
jgi:hypothetical protein